MTNAAVAEAQTTPEVEEPVTPAEEAVTTPASDADPQSQTDAAPSAAVDDAALDAAADAYAREMAEKEGKETPAPEAQTRPSVDPQDVANSTATYRANYAARQKALDDMEADLVEAGLAESVAKRFLKDAKDLLNSHHADGLQHAGYAALMQERVDVANGFESALPKTALEAVMPGLQKIQQEKGVVSYQQLFEAAYKRGKAEGVSEGKGIGRTEGYRAGMLHSQKVAATTSSGDSVEGGGNSGGRGNDVASFEKRLAAGESFTETEWASYDRARAAAGIRD